VQSFRGVTLSADQVAEPEEITGELGALELPSEPTHVVAADAVVGTGALPPEVKNATFYRPTGCEACSQTGYRGRIAISEMLIIDEAVRRDILNQSDAATIAKTAMNRGMRTLREDGARLVLHGITSLEEVLAATQAGEVDA
jgi:general secretion pathway protein E